MLREIKDTIHTDNGFNKKWYHSQGLDLFIWFRKGKLIKFQLCNKMKSKEEAIIWCRLSGLDFFTVDKNNHLQRNTSIRLHHSLSPVNSSIVSKFDRESYYLNPKVKLIIKSVIHLAVYN